MKFTKRGYASADYLAIRDFLSQSYRINPEQHNWMIDRWNFCRFFAQTICETFEKWPATTGIWIDENNTIAAVVNSEGENRGEAFIQPGPYDFGQEQMLEFLDHAEQFLSCTENGENYINLRINPNDPLLQPLVEARGYSKWDWTEDSAVFTPPGRLDYSLPEGFRIGDSAEVSDYKTGFAHGQAFGYYKGSVPDDADAENAFAALRNAPDYHQDLHLSILDRNDNVAAFACIWPDFPNSIAILEPVGTLPQCRKMGLGKAVIYEAINRVLELGIKKIYVGSGQQFYQSIGFAIESKKEIWQKRWS